MTDSSRIALPPVAEQWRAGRTRVWPRTAWARSVEFLIRLHVPDKVDHGNFTMKGSQAMGFDLSVRELLDLCLAENDRRLARCDDRLLRPQMLTRPIRFVRGLFGRTPEQTVAACQRVSASNFSWYSLLRASLPKIIGAAAILGVADVLPAAAAADEFKLGSLEIVQPWARATIGRATTGITFMTIENHGSDPDRLIAIASTIAANVELHEDKMENGVMKMRQLDEVDLNPGETVVFKPGGLHAMLIGVRKKLVEHDEFPMTLTFLKAGSVTIEVSVESVGATGWAN